VSAGLRRSAFSGCPPAPLEILAVSLTVLPTKRLFGHTRTMMTRANSRRREAESPIHFADHDRRTTSPHGHPRIQVSPRRRGCWTATAEIRVVDLIA